MTFKKGETPKGAKPFPKGVSGNPSGRPPGHYSIEAEVKRLMPLVLKGEINPLTEAPEDMPVNRKIALNLVMKAVADADLAAIREVRDMMDGKPAQALNIGGQNGENPVGITGALEVVLVKAKRSPDA